MTGDVKGGTDDRQRRDLRQPGGDRLRQALNLACALGQALTTALVVATGADNITGDDPGVITPIVPADYAFGIWGVIYGGSLAYAV